MARELVGYINTEIGTMIRQATWIKNETTRTAALDKWVNIKKNVGFSTQWYTYDGMSVTGMPFTDHGAVSAYYTQQAKLLYMTPQDRSIMFQRDYMDQNAYYQPNSNNINMLAGLMFAPYLSANQPFMFNLAAYGLVIGHEFTHGFDNNGRNYNGTGAWVNWWDDASGAAFDSQAQCFVYYYGNYTWYGQNINGLQTLGENIADNGGMHASWLAYQANAQLPYQLMQEYTNDQLYFLWYGQSWCSIETQAAGLNQLNDVHSPPKFRVNGPMSNFPQFANAWGCRADQPMGKSLLDSRCYVW